MASFLYGEPRLTQDIDIVADIQESHIPGLLRSFPATEFYIDESSIRRAILAKSQFKSIRAYDAQRDFKLKDVGRVFFVCEK